MTFQAPLALPVVTSSSVSINLVEPVAQTFPVGTILQVIVSENRQGQSGLTLNGNFFAATLPPTLKNGEQINVRVLQNTDVLVLKLLKPGIEAQPQYAPTLENVLKLFLTPQNLEQLKLSSVLNSSYNLPQSTKPPGQEELKTDFPQILSRLLAKHAAVGDETLSKPDSLQRILLNLGQNEVLRTLGEAKQALKEISRSTTSPGQAKLLAALEETLTKLIELPQPLQFEGEGASELLPHQIKLYLSASQYAGEHSNGGVLKRLSTQLTTLNSKSNPLQTLLQGLSNLEFSLPENSPPLERAAHEFLKQLGTELERLKHSAAGDKEVRAKITQMLESLREKFGSTKLNRAQTTESGNVVLKTLETVLNGQEVLNRLNPLMQSVGEPALVLIPFLSPEFIAKWEMCAEQPRVENDGSKKRSANDGFQRIHLHLAFPGLGNIEVDLAHKKEELLLTLTCEKKEISSHLENKLPQLEAIFKELGYKECSLKAQQGQPASVTPVWYRELTKRTLVV